MPQATKNIKPKKINNHEELLVDAPKTCAPEPVGEIDSEFKSPEAGVGETILSLSASSEDVGFGVRLFVDVGAVEGAFVGVAVGEPVGVGVGVGVFVGVGVGVGTGVDVGTGVAVLFENPLLDADRKTIVEEPSGFLPALCAPAGA